MDNCIVKKQKSIRKNDLSRKEFCKNSLCPLDYKKISISNNNIFPLKQFLSEKPIKGFDPGSADYMKLSKYRFLKTSNLSENYCLDDTIVEYCKPNKKHTNPKKNSIQTKTFIDSVEHWINLK